MHTMKKVAFIKNAAMITDLFSCLKKLSLFFQKPGINISEAQDVLQTTMDNLVKLQRRLEYFNLTNFFFFFIIQLLYFMAFMIK